MSIMTALSDSDPIMVAWREYQKSPEYQNTKKWALYPQHVDGSLWAAWLQGYQTHKSGVEMGGEKAAPELDLESKTPAGLPLTVGVEGDQLVIRMGVDTLAFCFEISESNQPFDEKANDYRREWKVTDRHKFAKGVCNGLMNEREDGSTPLSDLIDKAYTDAIESDMGVDEDGRIVTNEMLHPSPTFRRSSQNHTVSSGVEGAHEGTTADKSGPREPEKLNNALKGKANYGYIGSLQHMRARILELALLGAEAEREGLLAQAGMYRFAQEEMKKFALAESSLSSPPHEHNHRCLQIGCGNKDKEEKK